MDNKRKVLGELLSERTLAIMKELGCYEKLLICYADVLSNDEVAQVKEILSKFDDLEDNLITFIRLCR